MVANPLSLPARLWRDHGKTLLRFSRVSMVNVFIGQSLLFTFHSVLGWPGAFANAAAVAAQVGALNTNTRYLHPNISQLAAKLTANPLDAVTTVTAQMVTLLVGDQEFDSAKTLAAFALGLALFLATLALNVLALHIARKYRENYE